MTETLSLKDKILHDADYVLEKMGDSIPDDLKLLGMLSIQDPDADFDHYAGAFRAPLAAQTMIKKAFDNPMSAMADNLTNDAFARVGMGITAIALATARKVKELA